MYKKISIIGAGLIGGSLGLLIKKILPDTTLNAIDKSTVIGELPDNSPFDEIFTSEEIAEAIGKSDLIFLCLPISGIIDLLQKVISHAKQGAVICDVGSVKGAILNEAEKHSVSGVYFIGGHPIGGSEGHGFSDASAEYLNGINFIVSPVSDVPEEVVKKHTDFLMALNFNVVEMDPAVHDHAVAYTSHLPQFISTALALSMGEVEKIEQTAGPGLSSMTRLASSPPGIWNDIVRFNGKELIEAISVYSSLLSELKRDIEDGSIGEKFRAAAVTSSKFRGDK